MKTSKAIKVTLLLTCISAFSSAAISGTYYKWTDENGTTHYGNKPSDRHTSQPVQTSGGHSGKKSTMAPSQKTEAPSESPSQNEGSVVYDADELANYCKAIKKRLDLMTAKSRIKQKNKDGSVVMLTEEQRQQQISELKAKHADKCQ